MTPKASSDVLAIKIGARFLVVTVFPAVAFVALLLTLVCAGAPASRPAWDKLEAAVHGLNWIRVLVVLVVLLVVLAVLHPLNYALIRLAEGYWGGLPMGQTLQRALATRVERRRTMLRHIELEDPSASAELDWLPADLEPVFPTMLGNVLFAGEVRAGARYGYETSVVLPRLMPLLDENLRNQIADTRNQLDVAARICMLSLLAVPITTVLLIRYDTWLLVPMMCYLLAWMSYRSAVVAAKRFCEALAVAFDLHHVGLWDAMALPRPRSVDDVVENRGPMLTDLLAGQDLEPRDRKSLTYERRATGEQDRARQEVAA